MGLKMLRYLFYMVPVLWNLARDLLWEDLSLDEIKTNFFFGKANALERAGCFEKAVAVYEIILKQSPLSISVLLNLGGLYYRKGMFEDALTYYERVIQANPKHYQGHYWLAMCYWQLERYYAAINTLEEVIEFLPTFKDALNLVGECYEKIGEGAKAEHYYLKAISADPHGIIVDRGLLNKSPSDRRKEERIKH